MSLISTCSKLLWQDLQIAWRQRADVFEPVLFFVLITSLFPLALSPNTEQLQLLAPAIIWIAAVLASVLGLSQLFRQDFSDGSLEQLMLSPQPLPLLLFIKMLAHWLISGLPLLLCAPLAGLLLHMPFNGVKVLLISLLLGTPALSLIGAIGVGITLGLQNSGLLLPLLVLPLYTPTLIFAASSVANAGHGLPVAGALAWLSVILVLSLCLAPFAVSAAIKIGVKQ